MASCRPIQGNRCSHWSIFLANQNREENENKHSDRHNLAWILLLGLLGFLFEFFHSIFIRRGLSTFFVREYS